MIGFRLASSDDFAGLLALDTFAASDQNRAAEITGWLASAQVILATEDDAIVGYAALTRNFFHRPFVEMLMVATNARRRGVGRQLILHCAAQHDALWTSTNQSNAPMRALLESCGFILSGTIEGLDPGDPERIYRLSRKG